MKTLKTMLPFLCLLFIRSPQASANTHAIKNVSLALAASAKAPDPAYDKLIAPYVDKLDNTASVAGYQSLANDFTRVSTAYPNEWMGYYYTAYCYARIAWSYQDNGEKVEPFARQAETLIRKAESLAGSDNKALSEIYCVFSMVDRAYIFISPMSNGRTYGPPANQYIEKAKKANPDNARALYLDGWVKYNTPKLWGGDKKAAKELLQQALEKLKASPASPAGSTSPTGSAPAASTVFPHWGKADIELLLAQYK
jgi:hypothetical protein